MATGFEDFGGYSLGVPGDISLVVYSAFGNDAFWAHEIVELAGSVSGQALRVQSTQVDYAMVLFNAITGFADGEVALLVRLPGTPAGYYQGPAARMDGAESPTMIKVTSDSNNDVQAIWRHVASDNPTASVAGGTTAMAGGERWWFRFNFDGTALKAKWWKDGTSEPGSWTLSGTDGSAPVASGKVGADIRHGPSATFTTYIEALGWSDDPAVSAPLDGTVVLGVERLVSAEHHLVVASIVERPLSVERLASFGTERQLSAEHEGVFAVEQPLSSEHHLEVGSIVERAVSAEHMLVVSGISERPLSSEHLGQFAVERPLSSEHLLVLVGNERDLSAEHSLVVGSLAARTISIEHLLQLATERFLSAEHVVAIDQPHIKPWPSRWPRGNYPGLRQYDLSPSASFHVGDVVVKDGADEVIEATGFNPSVILGMAAEDSANVLEAGKVLVAVASDTLIYALEGSRPPVPGDVGQEYGLAATVDGVWICTPDEVINTRLEVMAVDVPRQLYFCKVLSAYRQE